MFKNEISQSIFCSGTADTVMSRISGDRFMGDCSFLSTARALLGKRIPEGDRLKIKITRNDYSMSSLNEASEENIAHAIYNTFSIGTGKIVIHYFGGREEEANKKSMEIASKFFIDNHKDFKKLDKISAFYQKAFPVACFVNDKKKSVVFFIEQMDYRRFHYIQCSILPMLPWYFNPKEGLSELEMKLIESLMGNDPEAYKDALKNIYETYDFRSDIIKNKLKGFELSYIQQAMRNEKRNYDNVIESINDYNRRIGDLLNEQNEINIRIAGMQSKIDSGEGGDEIMKYFLAHKNLELINARDGKVDFIARTTIDFYDPDMSERAINNKNSVLYRRVRDIGVSVNDMQKLYRAIFVDTKIKLNVCAAYSLSINGGVSPLSRYGFGENYADCMPHPHVDRYTCMGNYVQVINELMMKHDYIMSIEQCIASCRSLNFADSTVIGWFANVMVGHDEGLSYNNRCLVLPNGNVVDPKGAIEWIRMEENKDAQKKEQKEEK